MIGACHDNVDLQQRKYRAINVTKRAQRRRDSFTSVGQISREERQTLLLTLYAKIICCLDLFSQDTLNLSWSLIENRVYSADDLRLARIVRRPEGMRGVLVVLKKMRSGHALRAMIVLTTCTYSYLFVCDNACTRVAN